jgi:hypothetical protein
MQVLNTSFEAFKAVMFQVEISCVMTPCSVVVGYQHSLDVGILQHHYMAS